MNSIKPYIDANKARFLEELFEIKYQWQRYIENRDRETSSVERAMDTILNIIENAIPRIDGVDI